MKASYLPGLPPEEEKAYRKAEELRMKRMSYVSPGEQSVFNGVFSVIAVLVMLALVLVAAIPAAILIAPGLVGAFSGMSTHGLLVLIVILAIASALVRR